MIRHKTLLVIGAGASHSYGFPVGSGLKKEILHLTAQSTNTDFARYLSVHKVIADPNDIASFYSSFQGASLYSIDRYLSFAQADSRRASHVAIGKHAIAWALCSKETMGGLNKPTEKDNWYEYLWNCVDRNFSNGTQNLLSIISFNYDRSLEAYLESRVQITFNVSAEEARNRVREVPIIHMYGQLGSVEQGDAQYRPYAPPGEDWLQIERAAEMISVIGERSNTMTNDRAVTQIRLAERVAFLGFGFDPDNMEILGFSPGGAKDTASMMSRKQLVGFTTHGLSRAQINMIKGSIGTGADISLHKCEEGLRELGTLL
jgi:hypothetical protein